MRGESMALVLPRIRSIDFGIDKILNAQVTVR